MPDFTLNMPNEDDRLRQAFRTRIPGADGRVSGTDRIYEVKDLSATGFALGCSDGSFKEGQEFKVDLLLNRKPFITEIGAKVMRVLANGIVGCNFLGLDRRQQIKLDKLVLEVQKRLIAMRKAKKEEE
jgi:c-di-GMP-binding flagellar brake protein YcgR